MCVMHACMYACFVFQRLEMAKGFLVVLRNKCPYQIPMERNIQLHGLTLGHATGIQLALEEERSLR